MAISQDLLLAILSMDAYNRIRVKSVFIYTRRANHAEIIHAT